MKIVLISVLLYGTIFLKSPSLRALARQSSDFFKNRIVQRVFIFLLSINNICYADKILDNIMSYGWSPVITLSTGGGYAQNIAQTQSIYTNIRTLNFTPDASTARGLILGGYAAFEHNIFTKNLLQLGISYYQPRKYKINGQLNSSTTNTDYTYYYNIGPQQLLAETKFIYQNNHVMPYFNVGLGLGWLIAHKFSTDFPNLTFDDKTKANFSYSLGAGVDYDFSERFRLGVGYRFMYFGNYKTKLGYTTTTTDLGPLKADNLFNNAIVVNITFIQGSYRDDEND